MAHLHPQCMRAHVAYLLCLLALVLAGVGWAEKAPTAQWARRVGGVGDDVGYCVAAAPNGGAYLTGYFSGTATFAPGVTRTSTGSSDYYLAK